MPKEKHYVLVSPLEAGGSNEFAFTYSADEPVEVGRIIEVPFGRRRSLGVVMAAAEKPAFITKPIGAALELPPLPHHLLKLAEWLAEYYVAGPKAVWQTLLPAGITTKRREAKAKPLDELKAVTPTKLNPAQAKAVEGIWNGDKSAYLLHGVTGSGKTEVYIELARRTLAAGQSVIVLVPEIALTPQIESRFAAAFKNLIIASHSRMTPAQRHLAWLAALNAKEPQVVVGPRSALFLPLASPGLIIIDECHETTYKQEQNPRYQTDISAARLIQLTGAKLILGSATPSLGQYYLAEQGRLGKIELTARANELIPAKPHIIDLRDKSLLNRSRFLARPLLSALEATLAEGRQSLLFINRRGSASSLLCGDCGWVATCPHCGIALTFHADSLKLLCHYCGYTQAPPAVCPECNSTNLRYVGGGTKRIETEIAKLLPKARLARLDKDSATPQYLHQVYNQLHSGEIDILIGTQIVAKGWDLPRMDCVGIVSADTMLHIPDYTAGERTFQLIAQVSGRTGRGDRPGQVFIQSYTPDHPAITAAAAGDYHRFAAAELAERRLLGYPPYVFLLKLTYSAADDVNAQTKAEAHADQLRQDAALSISGPAPAFHGRSAGRYHWQVIVKAKSRGPLVAAVRNLPSGWTADLDPINLL